MSGAGRGKHSAGQSGEEEEGTGERKKRKGGVNGRKEKETGVLCSSTRMAIKAVQL